jgi:uncharacterized OB-fold protein
MPYLSARLPMPTPTIDDAPFWAAAAEQRLVFQRCADCSRHRHPPSPMCPSCQSMNVEWSETSGPAKLFSYTVTHVEPHPELKGRAPYVVALVIFPELDDVRLVTNVVDADEGELHIGSEVTLTWESVGDGMCLPRFRLLERT